MLTISGVFSWGGQKFAEKILEKFAEKFAGNFPKLARPK